MALAAASTVKPRTDAVQARMRQVLDLVKKLKGILSADTSWSDNVEKNFVYFLQLSSKLDFSHGKFGLLSPGKPAATESRYPTYGAYWMV